MFSVIRFPRTLTKLYLNSSINCLSFTTSHINNEKVGIAVERERTTLNFVTGVFIEHFVDSVKEKEPGVSFIQQEQNESFEEALNR